MRVSSFHKKDKTTGQIYTDKNSIGLIAQLF